MGPSIWQVKDPSWKMTCGFYTDLISAYSWVLILLAPAGLSRENIDICQIQGLQAKCGPPSLVFWALPHSPLATNRVTLNNAEWLPMSIGNLSWQAAHLSMNKHNLQQTLVDCHTLVLEANQALLWAVHGCTVSLNWWAMNLCVPCISVWPPTANPVWLPNLCPVSQSGLLWVLHSRAEPQSAIYESRDTMHNSVAMHCP